MKFLTVENRVNRNIRACIESAREGGIDLEKIESTEESQHFLEFKTSYIHLSTNDLGFELICFRRYFILESYLNANPHISEFVLIDSDILIFQGITEHIRTIIEDADFAGCFISDRMESDCQISPHVSYWKRESLFDFTEYLTQIYKSDKGRKSLEIIHQRFTSERRRGGVSDMTLLYLWASQKSTIRSLNQIRDGNVIDHNISIPHNFHTDEYLANSGFKTIRFIRNEPYLVENVEHQSIKALALHFQGKAKGLMPLLQENRTLRFKLACRLIAIAKLMRRNLYKYTG